MDLWVEKAMHNGIIVTGEVLRAKWRRFEELAGIPQDDWLSLSGGWMDSLKAWNGLKQMKRHGEAASASIEDAEADRERVKKILKDGGYAPRDIFNMDETGLFWA